MKTTSTHCSILRGAALALAAALATPLCSWAQGSALLTVDPPQRIVLQRNGNAEAALAVHLRSGYHVNSNTPNEDYLIPLRLTWETAPLKPAETVFPKPEQRNYAFSTKPVSVFTGDFKLLERFHADAKAPPGPGVIVGKLRYQACSNDTCFPPKTVEIRLPYELR